MTARLVFEATLIELSKQQTPSLKLWEFNYLFNKAINQYINKVYNTYDINQQTTDDLRVLKATAYLKPEKWDHGTDSKYSATKLIERNASSYLSRAHKSIQSLHGATYEVAMPIDYLHLLNCVCIYYVAKQKDCWDAGSYIEIPANRLTADSWSQIVTDIYNRPSPMKPYYYIHNQNNNASNKLLPTDPITQFDSKGSGMPNGTDMTGTYKVTTNGMAITKYENKFYIKRNGDWYEITGGIEEKNGYAAAKENQKIELAQTAVDNTDKLINILETGGTDAKPTITLMYYPDPENTIAYQDRDAIGDADWQYGNGLSNFLRTIKMDLDGNGEPDTNVSLVEKPIGLRAGNVSNVRMEIRYGKILPII